jgi:putative membrane protein
MFGTEHFGFSLWWIFPIVMAVFCFFMMRGMMGSMMCGSGSHKKEGHSTDTSDSARDILDKQYAKGEIDKEEYEEKKKALTGPADHKSAEEI